MTYPMEGALDLEACETEPVHHIGALQAPFAMAVFCPERRTVVAVSDNLPGLSRRPLAALDGVAIEEVFAAWPAQLDEPRTAAAEAAVARLRDGTDCILRLHDAGAYRAAVIDPCPPASSCANGLSALMRFNALLERALSEARPDVTALARGLTEAFRDISGFDRVMVYRFDTDWNGTIIAESAAEGLCSRFLGLTFPSSDIPRPARRLFLENRVRPIFDIESPPVGLHAFGGTPAQALDIGAVPERAVSPIHLAYLANMGVRATLTVALVVGGRLWGLLTCHHYSGPRRLSPVDMDLCHVVCDLLSHGLSRLEERSQREDQRLIDALAREMRADAQDDDLSDDPGRFFGAFGARILDILGAGGAELRLNDRVLRLGAELGPLAGTLNDRLLEHSRRIDARQTVTNHVAAFLPDLAEALLPACAGTAFARHESGASTLMAWRPASPQVETWAGDPDKRVTRNGPLSPRASFERWQTETVQKCLPWPEDQANRTAAMLGILSEVGCTLERRRAERTAVIARRRAEEAQAAVEHSALHDALTDLPNRRYLERTLARLAEGGGPDADRVAVLHIDLDRFKAINDTLGHGAGDATLQHVARTLRDEKRETDFVARIGGDEFVLVAGTRIAERDLETLAARIIAELSRPFHVAGETVYFGASIGIAYAARAGLDPGALLARADIALYEAKREGRGRFRFVSDEMEQARIERRLLGEDVQRGFEAQEFELFFQLQFDAGTGAVAGAEGLLRWNHPLRGTLAPAAFLDAAEDVGLIDKLDALAVDAALAAQARWAEAGLHVPRIGLNTSARRLRDMDVAALIRGRPGISDRIAFELLETMDLNAMDTAIRWNIDRVREAGFAIEIDDFGTGHTSILSLVRLKPDRVKIDKDLVIPVVESEVAREVVGSIVQIARTLGISVTAEGVETARHAAILRELGCDVFQGFALAVPRSVEGVLADLALRDTA